MSHTQSLVASVFLLTACKDDKPPAPPAAPTESAKPAPTDGEASALAAKPKQRVAIAGLGLSIEVPEGTSVTPPRDADEAARRAHLKQGAFKVNVDAVDEYSTPSFAKAKEVYKDDKLVSWIRADETSTGWITFKEVISSLHESRRFEVNVRTTAGGKKWDCAVSAPSKPLAELTLAACQTLTTIGQ